MSYLKILISEKTLDRFLTQSGWLVFPELASRTVSAYAHLPPC